MDLMSPVYVLGPRALLPVNLFRSMLSAPHKPRLSQRPQ
jgi:hypothetical protein